MSLGPESDDRGVEGEIEEVIINGEEVEIQGPPALDGLGNPAAKEDDMGEN
jgi:hypothetical protein